MVKENKASDKSILFEYPTPFYLMGSGAEQQVIYGIKTQRFTYVEQDGRPWLLYDKHVDSAVNINMTDVDEYIFIQLDLARQLHELLEKSEFSVLFKKYFFYSPDSVVDNP